MVAFYCISRYRFTFSDGCLMPITVSCPCQNTYRVKDELAGKKIKCPHCQQPVDVPLYDEPAPVAAPDPYGGMDTQAFPSSSPTAGSIEPHHEHNDEFSLQHEQPPQMVSSYAGPDSHVGYGPDSTPTAPQASSGVNAGAIVAGLAMMGGAVLWFVVGMAAGRIFFYPPILFIFGLISFVKGLMGSD